MTERSEKSSERTLALLAHDLRNSTTVLFGVLDHLADLKDRVPTLAGIISDLTSATQNIQQVTRELSSKKERT